MESQISKQPTIPEERASKPSEISSLCFVSFRLGGRTFAFPLQQVERVVRMVAVTPVPGEPPWIAGAVNLHGLSIPVVSLHERIFQQPRTLNVHHRMMVVRVHKEIKTFIVEDVTGVITIPSEDLATAPVPLSKSPFFLSVIQHDDAIIPVLNAERLLDADVLAPALESPRDHDEEEPSLPQHEESLVWESVT